VACPSESEPTQGNLRPVDSRKERILCGNVEYEAVSFAAVSALSVVMILPQKIPRHLHGAIHIILSTTLDLDLNRRMSDTKVVTQFFVHRPQDLLTSRNPEAAGLFNGRRNADRARGQLARVGCACSTGRAALIVLSGLSRPDVGNADPHV
jgi:hypothetical protein